MQLLGCGDGKTSFKIRNGYCYYFSSSYINMDGAKTACEKIGAILTSVSSSDEMDYIATNMQPFYGHSFWIGLRKDEIGQWPGLHITWRPSWMWNPGIRHFTRRNRFNVALLIQML